MDSPIRQRIRYLRSDDGVKLAWAEAGSGPTLVRAANWLTHLEYDLESPVWRHWIRFLSAHTRFVRYDHRGSGMSDPTVADMSWPRWTEDLEQVTAAAAPEEPVTLLGISQGAAVCVAYAAKHPERVSSLILFGGYARGWARRNDPHADREYQAIVELIRVGWGKDNAAFREVFTSRFIPGGTRAQLDWFNDLCRKTATPDIAAEVLLSPSQIDLTADLDKVQAPTLVLHVRDDAVVPIAEGRLLAAGIPGAEFVELDSKNHILLEDEPAWGRFCGAVLEFLGLGARSEQEDPAFAGLTARERGILALLTEGLSNADIALRLSLSEKTVRNHISNVFDKLGVWTRAQAIVFARDRRFRG
jgi:pimeloyl-ACP methyl ester carboxylesterase/DNA-binding CsgD family transcriptional regulator